MIEREKEEMLFQKMNSIPEHRVLVVDDDDEIGIILDCLLATQFCKC